MAPSELNLIGRESIMTIIDPESLSLLAQTNSIKAWLDLPGGTKFIIQCGKAWIRWWYPIVEKVRARVVKLES
uniref:Uncharacterized protein n=2 Tax=Cucumis melo TaxID=3656 RepID=A0A9I9DY55_CUCME